MDVVKKDVMYNCFDVAKGFLKLADDDGDRIKPMKLLKLTYIAQGYYLGLCKRPLFHNEIQAWKYGPVIPDLYEMIKVYNKKPVDIEIIDLHTSKNLETFDEDFLRVIWDSYKEYTGLQLSDKTHEEGSPWYEVFSDNVLDTVMSNEMIKDYYAKIIQ